MHCRVADVRDCRLDRVGQRGETHFPYASAKLFQVESVNLGNGRVALALRLQLDQPRVHDEGCQEALDHLRLGDREAEVSEYAAPT
jgi:hypothetical protein